MTYMIFGKENQDAVRRMEQFVAGHARGHFLQLPRWAEVKTFWDWSGILILQNGEITAAMSVLIRPIPLGLSVLYAPRGPVCDRADPEIWRGLMQALKELARLQRSVLLYLDPDEPEHEGFSALMRKLGFREKADTGFGNIQPQYVFRLDLDGKTETEIFDAFASKTRYNIRLSRRRGVCIREFSGAEEIPAEVLDSFSALMEVTGQRDHFRVRGREYFQNLLKALGNDARLFMAYFEERPIAGAIEVFCGRKAWYLYGASSDEHREAMPNYLLQWTMIRCALGRGCGLYDFRGVPGEPSKGDPLYGLYRFKKGFSGVYTKFTGLFGYSFCPILGFLLQDILPSVQRLRIKIRSAMGFTERIH